MIANFNEYIATLRSLFAHGRDAEIEDYASDIKQSGQKQRVAKQRLQQEIALTNAQINQLRSEITVTEDKKELSTQIKRLKAAKESLVKRIKKRDSTSRFAVLAPETKASLCTLTVLRKHLTKEILENQFLGVLKDSHGNVIFNRTYFETTQLYHDAQHIHDYISAYIMQNPNQVVSESYFNKLFSKESGWRGICQKADKFFEDINKAKRKKTKAEIIAESRSDLELIKEYKKDNILFVRLKTPEALDYEGAAAHNCVGGGGYDKLLNQDKSGIYSLRRFMPDGELKPVVTIEYSKGNINQIKGVCNSIVPFDCNLLVRDVAMNLLNKKSQDELAEDKSVSEGVLNSMGLYRDGHGGYVDIYNLSGDEDFELPDIGVSVDSLKHYEWEKLKIGNIKIFGEVRKEHLPEINRLLNAKTLLISDLADDFELDVSKFKRLKEISLNTVKNVSCHFVGNNTTLEKIDVTNMNLDKDFAPGCSNLAQITLRDTSIPVLDLAKFPLLKTLYMIKNGKPSEMTIQGNNNSIERLEINNINLANGFDITCQNLRTIDLIYTSLSQFDISKFPSLEELHFSNSNEPPETITLIGNNSSLTKLSLGNTIISDMSFRQFSNIKEVLLSRLDLNAIDFNKPQGVLCNYSNCILNEKQAKGLIGSNIRYSGSANKVVGKNLDFSDLTEYVMFDNLQFPEAETIKLSPKIKHFNFGAGFNPQVELLGLDEIEVCASYGLQHRFLNQINPLKLKELNFNDIFSEERVDISKFTNLRTLSICNTPIHQIPSSVEDLYISMDILRFDNHDTTPNTDENVIVDLTHLQKLRNLRMDGISANVTVIKFPENVEELTLFHDMKDVQELDFSRCHKLKSLRIGILARKMKKVRLPASLDKLQAEKSPVGVGMKDFSDKKPLAVTFEIPSTAKPEIIQYLREQWGEKQVKVIPQSNKRLSMLVVNKALKQRK